MSGKRSSIGGIIIVSDEYFPVFRTQLSLLSEDLNVRVTIFREYSGMFFW